MKRALLLLALLAAPSFVAHAQPGWVLDHQKISDTEGGFIGVLDDEDGFGNSVASLGDLDDDGVQDLVVGAWLDDDGGGYNRGAVWVLFLNADGTVRAHQKISSTEGGFTGTLDDAEGFGYSVASMGDLDGDGIPDLAIGVPFDDFMRGAVWVLFLNADGTVRAHQKISSTEGGFTGTLEYYSWFGSSLAALGDLDGDGVTDLVAGAPAPSVLTNASQAVWVLFLNADGTVKGHQKISDTDGGFTGQLDRGDEFGASTVNLGDLDGVGVPDLAVGASRDEDGGADRGAVWVLFLNADGTVKGHQKISDADGGFTGTLDEEDAFGRSVSALDDLDGDGVPDLTVGADNDDDGGWNRGAVWVLFLDDASGLTLTLTPPAPPVVVPPEGGQFDVIVTVTNTTAELQTVEAWVEATQPDGQVLVAPAGPLLGPFTVTLGPGETVERTLVQRVPAHAMGGEWAYTGYVGGYPDAPVAESGFAVMKVTQSPALPVDQHTLALYTFDGTNPDTTFDVSGNGHHAFNDGTTSVPGRHGNARQFDGLDDRIDIDAVRVALQGATAWTFEYIARSEDENGIPFLLAHPCENGWRLRSSNTSVRYAVKTTTSGPGCAWNPDVILDVAPLGNAWHYFALVFGDGGLRLYIDGSLVDSQPASGVFLGSGGSYRAWIGYNDFLTGYYAPGLADELRVSEVVRSADEICATANRLGWPCESMAAAVLPAASASPDEVVLSPSQPNPLRTQATLRYGLPEAARVRLAVYDLLGRQVAVLVDGEREAGWHAAHLDASGLAAGTYLYRLTAGDFHATGRLTVVR